MNYFNELGDFGRFEDFVLGAFQEKARQAPPLRGLAEPAGSARPATGVLPRTGAGHGSRASCRARAGHSWEKGRFPLTTRSGRNSALPGMACGRALMVFDDSLFSSPSATYPRS